MGGLPTDRAREEQAKTLQCYKQKELIEELAKCVEKLLSYVIDEYESHTRGRPYGSATNDVFVAQALLKKCREMEK